MIAGIGIDVVDLGGFRLQLADRASQFEAQTFTMLELAEVASRPGTDRTPHLAARFAAKEAFIKAWSAANRAHPPALPTVLLHEIEVVSDARHRPSLRLHGQVAQAVAPLELIGLHVSLSHDGSTATAMVVLERAS